MMRRRCRLHLLLRGGGGGEEEEGKGEWNMDNNLNHNNNTTTNQVLQNLDTDQDIDAFIEQLIADDTTTTDATMTKTTTTTCFKEESVAMVDAETTPVAGLLANQNHDDDDDDDNHHNNNNHHHHWERESPQPTTKKDQNDNDDDTKTTTMRMTQTPLKVDANDDTGPRRRRQQQPPPRSRRSILAYAGGGGGGAAAAAGEQDGIAHATTTPAKSDDNNVHENNTVEHLARHEEDPNQKGFNDRANAFRIAETDPKQENEKDKEDEENPSEPESQEIKSPVSVSPVEDRRSNQPAKRTKSNVKKRVRVTTATTNTIKTTVQDDENQENATATTTDVPVPSEQTPAGVAPSPQRRRRRPPPPPLNPLYRFLLYRGRFGHILVMNMVLISEWVSVYLPPLAHSLTWLDQKVWRRRRRPGRYNDDFDDDLARRRAIPFSSARISSILTQRRTGRSKQLTKKLLRQADEAALEQLRRVGNVQQAKYRHVSREFLQRHGLGPFAATAVATKKHGENNTVVAERKGPLASTSDQPRAIKEDDDNDDDSWVLDALTKTTSQTIESSAGSVNPTLSLQVGEKGPTVSVGVDFSFGNSKRSKSRAKPKRPPRKYRPPAPRPNSKRSGETDFLERIRAATAANSRMSRNLLGAYPGDAVPPSEAASAEGVIALAQRYGYGDWSDDDDELQYESNEGGDTRRKRRKKHREISRHTPNKRRSPNITLDLSGGHSRPSVPASERRHQAVPIRSEPKPPKLRTLDNEKCSPFKNEPERGEPARIRSAMERLEALKNSRGKKDEK